MRSRSSSEPELITDTLSEKPSLNNLSGGLSLSVSCGYSEVIEKTERKQTAEDIRRIRKNELLKKLRENTFWYF